LRVFCSAGTFTRAIRFAAVINYLIAFVFTATCTTIFLATRVLVFASPCLGAANRNKGGCGTIDTVNFTLLGLRKNRTDALRMNPNRNQNEDNRPDDDTAEDPPLHAPISPVRH
jgi:hypothetical protein